MEVEDCRSDASRLPRGQRIPAGHHALNSCAVQRQINITNPLLRSTDLSKSFAFPTRVPLPAFILDRAAAWQMMGWQSFHTPAGQADNVSESSRGWTQL